MVLVEETEVCGSECSASGSAEQVERWLAGAMCPSGGTACVAGAMVPGAVGTLCPSDSDSVGPYGTLSQPEYDCVVPVGPYGMLSPSEYDTVPVSL